MWQDLCMMHEMIYKALGLSDRSNLSCCLGEMVEMKMVVETAGNLLSYQSLNRIDKTKSSPIENYTLHIKVK